MILLFSSILVLLTLTAATTESPQQRYTNLVLEGGGVKGASFVGAMRALETYGYFTGRAYNFRDIAGTSIGCVFGLAVALDIEPAALERLVLDTDFGALFDPAVGELLDYPSKDFEFYAFSTISYVYRWTLYVYRALRIWLRVAPRLGLSDETNLIAWLETRLLPLSRHADQLSLNSTLAELATVTNHTLTCFATRVFDVSIVRMSAELSPTLTLRDTVYASASLPFVFQPKTDTNGFPLVDGSLLLNFPIYTFDERDREDSGKVLGLSLNSAPYDIVKVQPGECPHTNARPSLVSRLLSGVADFIFSGSQSFPVNSPSLTKTQQRQTNTVAATNVNFIKNIIKIVMQDRERLYYGSDERNCDRVIYLDSPVHVLELDVGPEKLTRAIDTAHANTRRFFDDHESVVCGCLSGIRQRARYHQTIGT